MAEIVDAGSKPDPNDMKNYDFSRVISAPRFANKGAKLTIQDLNARKNNNTSFTKYSKDDIAEYLSDPAAHEKELREAVVYIYGASCHFRRLIQYFTSLTDFSYIISPFQIDTKKANNKTVMNNYKKTLKFMSGLNAKTQLSKILKVCLREDTFFGTVWLGNDNTTIQRLPSDFCAISSIEENVANVSFNFSYFDRNEMMLEFYPPEFKTKYEHIYKKDKRGSKWIELDSPTSFAVKVNNDILEYSLPPFAGILRELFDLEDYKSLKLARTSLENYAMLAMTIPMNKDGTWGLDLNKAQEFWENLDYVLPEEIGSVLSPMPIDKISFERNNNGDNKTISDAEQNIFTAAGVNSLLFNNEKASANALALSIKADQAMTYEIVKSIEDVINRILHHQSFGKNFKVTFLDTSSFNKKEQGDAYLKACSFGIPMISYYCSSQGLNQIDIDAMNFLECDLLGLPEMFQPLVSSSQMSNKPKDPDKNEEGGAPEKEGTDLTDSGEQSREDKDDW